MRLMGEKQERAEIVKSGTWLYDGLIPSEVWIVKQNFEYHYEEDYTDKPEALNADGECYGIIIARNGTKIGRGSEQLTLEAAVHAAEHEVPGLVWDDHLLQQLHGGRWYSRTPLKLDDSASHR